MRNTQATFERPHDSLLLPDRSGFGWSCPVGASLGLDRDMEECMEWAPQLLSQDVAPNVPPSDRDRARMISDRLVVHQLCLRFELERRTHV